MQAEEKTGGKKNGNYLYETITRSRRTFRSSDPPLEPKMAPYIFTERNGIYIIDLQKTVKKVEEAYNFMRDVAATRRKHFVRRHQKTGSGSYP